MEYAISERPKSLEEFVGNTTVKEMFSKFFSEKNLPHKLLFLGSSGTGKTTMVQIVKNYLNVNETFNLYVVDCGAQKDIATARETVKVVSQPNFGSYDQNVLIILEEVHRLSKQVQEVWLATLENLKENQYVLASTDQPESLIKTFRSRFMEVNLKPLTASEIVEGILAPVIRKNSIKIKRSTAHKIAELAEGNNRTALSILTQIAGVDPEKHEEVLNTFSKDKVYEPLYKAIDRLIKYAIIDKTLFKDYCAVMNVLKNSGLEPEAIRYSIVKQAGNNLKNPDCSMTLVRSAFLADAFENVTCYGELGWASLGLGIYKFFDNFVEREP